MRQRVRTHYPPPRHFRDRIDAGGQLAAHLDAFRGRGALVLGIPRGGVPVASEVAKRLNAELNIVVARKLGAPGHEELAIGAVTANGGQYLNHEIIQALGVTREYLDAVIAEQMGEAHRREETLRGSAPRPQIAGRLVIVVDDGLATGATARAAVRSVRKQQPARLVLAVPVGARESCAELQSEVDDLICPSQPEAFLAVGLWYAHFEPTSDAEVRQLVETAYATHATAPAGTTSPIANSEKQGPGGARA
jgi:putative phosphoribosyl transferase